MLHQTVGQNVAWVGTVVGAVVLPSKLATPKLHEFEDDWFTVLEKVQATTPFIENNVEVRKAYGIGRSEWRGVTAHARNMEVSVELLIVNCWRK
jgi:hypothetical protein